MTTITTPAWRKLEQQLVTYPLRFARRDQDAGVEWHRFPSMAGIYWGLVENDLPPQQSAFVERVRKELPDLPQPAVVARALKTYPAFVRQHHFELVLRNRFDLVVSSLLLDMRGIDILIIQRGRAYGLDLSVDTDMARLWAQVKQRRNPPLPDIPILKLEVKPYSYTAGKFWLHDPKEVDRVLDFIIQH